VRHLTLDGGFGVAKTNYQQLRKQKEAARKSRRQDKLDRRVPKDPGESTVAPPDVGPVNEPVPTTGDRVE
jgi:hypothetical protein